MFWNEELETISRSELEKLQVERLRLTVARAADAPFYREKFANSAVPTEINDTRDIRQFPFTDKSDLRSAFPYGMLASTRDEIVRLHSSSGTTGTATVVYHTRSDIDNWSDIMARCIYMAGVRETDVFQNIVGYGLFTGGLGFHYGMEKVGAMVIPSGTGNSRRQIRLMQDFDTSVIHATPSYALRLADVFNEMGIDPSNDVKLNIGFFGAEPYSEATRERLEEIFGILAVNSYGLSEMNGPGVGMECSHKTGIHLWEDHFLIEIIDPETLEPLPPGKQGELVLTTLNRDGMPIIRYRTKDLTSLIPEPCPCGRSGFRYKVIGRSDDMLKVKGVMVYPSHIKGVVNDFVPRVTGEMRIVLDEKPPRVVPPLKVRVEHSEGMSAGELKALENEIVEAMSKRLKISPRILWAEPGSLERSHYKGQTFEKLYEE